MCVYVRMQRLKFCLCVCVVKRIILTQGDSANWLILCHGHQFLIPLTSHQRVLHHRPK